MTFMSYPGKNKQTFILVRPDPLNFPSSIFSQTSLVFLPSRLQITTRLISKYPMSFPHCERPHLLSILYQLLSQQRRRERMPYVLRCLKEVAWCQSQQVHLKPVQNSELLRIWSKVWSLVIRSLSLQQTEVECFGLLQVMIQGGLIAMDREIWKIFSLSACKPSR